MKAYKLIILFLLSSLLLNSIIYGQVLAPTGGAGYESIPNFYSSPVEMSSGKYQSQIDNFTGAKMINLPVYTYESNGFTLPISLNYSASGVKLIDEASWVGLKWDLYYGGSITRVVNDLPDEGVYGYYTMEREGVDVNGNIESVTNDNSNANAARLVNVIGAPESGTPYDKEPDIFSYSINGISGKFIIGAGRTAKLIPYNGLQIIPDITDGSTGGIPTSTFNSFTIIDQKGVKYLFSTTQNIVITSTIHPDLGPHVFRDDHTQTESFNYTSAWNLTKIILPINNKEINFAYADEQYTLDEPLSVWGKGCPDGTCSAAFTFTGPNGQYSIGGIYSTTYETISDKRLVTISDQDGQVINFKAQNTSREDLTNSYALDEIKVTREEHGFTETFKDFKFNYHYYEGNDDGSSSYLSLFNSGVNDYASRLMLESVNDISTTGAIKKLYSFEYNEDHNGMPTRFSFEQDFWGYYNGNGAATIFPKIYIYPYETGNNRYTIYPKPNYSNLELQLPGADRTPNNNTISTGSLNKITYATGGYTSFDYECNDFYYDGSNHLGPGIRVKKITISDGNNSANDIIKTYSYKQSANPSRSSGVLFNLPVFAFPENTHPYSIVNSDGISATFDVRNYSEYTIDYYQNFLTRNCMPQFSSASSDNVDQGYSEITETNADQSKIIYKFSVPGYYGQNDDQEGVGCSSATDGYCDGLFKRFFSSYCSSVATNQYMAAFNVNLLPDLKGYNVTANSILPYGLTTNYEWNRGLILDIKAYDKDNFLLKDNARTYKLYYPNGKTTPGYLAGVKIDATDNWQLDAATNTAVNSEPEYSRMYFFSKYEIITDVAKVVGSETETVYDKNNSGQSIQTQTTYDYNGINHTNPTKITFTDSKANQKITTYTYSFDIAGAYWSHPEDLEYPQLGFNALASKGINTVIKEVHSLKYAGANDEYVTSASIIYFNAVLLNDHYIEYGNVLPAETKVLRINSPVLKSSLSDVINSNLNNPINNPGIFVDDRYKTENTFTSYDDNGNLLESSTLSQKQSAIWDYNEKYCIAKAINASKQDIAYTSFETVVPSSAGWVYNNSGVVADNTSPTGDNCFSLSAGAINNSYVSTYTSPRIYLISYWYKNGSVVNVNAFNPANIKTGASINGWTYTERQITIQPGTSLISLSGTGFVDELRLYPVDAQMATFTYTPLVGITSQCDASNKITYYEYDDYNYLTVIRDQDRNIIKKICHNNSGQSGDCSNTFYNAALSKTYRSQLCGTGYRGALFTYTVPAQTYSSSTSQYAADQLAINDQLLHGQANANSGNTCEPIANFEVSKTLPRNNCGANATPDPATYTYVVPAGTYTATDQAVADQLANDDIDQNAQGQANAHGSCTCLQGVIYKVINGVCEKGTPIVIDWIDVQFNADGSVHYLPTRTYNFKIHWSDGTVRGFFTQGNPFYEHGTFYEVYVDGVGIEDLPIPFNYDNGFIYYDGPVVPGDPYRD